MRQINENYELKAEIAKLRHYIDELKKELESKKNRKFQTRCIQIAKILNEEPIIEYRPSFMQGLELDAFFQKYRIALEVQGAHSTRWYKDIKKLEDIVNHDRQKRCICLDNGIFLIEVSVGDEIDETHGRCRGPLMIVDMIPKSDRNHIATSLGLELQDGDQNDDIGYMKKKFLSVILKKLVIKDLTISLSSGNATGLLFMDCFGRVFDLDSMGNVLWLLGDYSKRVERVTKGLKTGRGHHGFRWNCY
ncbi:hypothetical protein RhiirA1_498681 [Rhizophagus irregularis]|uniref:Uncharacterized protein n=1 Tax=Rhizophagus irregularis TaxID=588596 RepID=A0A2N0SJB8_9GLOM|nr:hypothetical protein RhiirA1_498681 [Rhizophagus irregularis]